MASVAVAEIKLVELLHSRVRKRPFTDVGSPDRPYRGRFRSRRGASHEALVRFNGPITPSHYVHDGWLDTSLAARNSATSADLAKSTPIAQYAALNLPIILTTVAPRWFEYDLHGSGAPLRGRGERGLRLPGDTARYLRGGAQVGAAISPPQVPPAPRPAEPLDPPGQTSGIPAASLTVARTTCISPAQLARSSLRPGLTLPLTMTTEPAFTGQEGTTA